MTLLHYSYYYVIICHILYTDLSSIIPAHCCIYVVNVYNICFLYLCYTPYGVIILRINHCHCHCPIKKGLDNHNDKCKDVYYICTWNMKHNGVINIHILWNIPVYLAICPYNNGNTATI